MNKLIQLWLCASIQDARGLNLCFKEKMLLKPDTTEITFRFKLRVKTQSNWLQKVYNLFIDYWYKT
jgi:hypothetical protein